jgi:uncharacterized protein YkwD
MRFLLSLGFFLAAVAVGLPAQVPETIPAPAEADLHLGVEQETFLLINQYREAHDFPALKWDDSIAKVARAHSRDMATGEVDFGHDGFRERINHLRNVMTGFAGAGENVFMSDNSEGVAKSAVAMWLQSPHHLENIRGDYNYSGLGVWQDKNGAIYFTQIFMKFSPKTEEAQAAPSSGIFTPFGMLAVPSTRGKP